jgi:hypothetical protein
LIPVGSTFDVEAMAVEKLRLAVGGLRPPKPEFQSPLAVSTADLQPISPPAAGGQAGSASASAVNLQSILLLSEMKMGV